MKWRDLTKGTKSIKKNNAWRDCGWFEFGICGNNFINLKIDIKF